VIGVLILKEQVKENSMIEQKKLRLTETVSGAG
jgi:hypothetical protein